MACQLGCPTACGILVPRPGIEPISLALEDIFLTTESPGKSHGKLFLEHFKTQFYALPSQYLVLHRRKESFFVNCLL